MDYFDISPLVRASTAVFPGDTPFTRRVLMAFEAGHHLALSTIETTVHIGAHADAPSHYDRRGAAIAERSLVPYYGPCRVVTVRLPRGERVRPHHLEGAPIDAPRVLLRTGSFPDSDAWNGDFNALSPELVHHLADRGVTLVGIDTPSVDPATDAELPSHHALFARDMSVLEGLVLTGVPDGRYVLTALPLRLEGADASPVRAVLWKEAP